MAAQEKPVTRVLATCRSRWRRMRRRGPQCLALPVLPRVRLAARYLRARNDRGPGAVWIDAVVLQQRVVALMTGTAGDRLRAVPGAAAQLRMLLRGTLGADAGPAQALSYLSDFAARSADGTGPTAWVAQLDPVTGELRYASAGHPMPLVCGPSGEATFLSPRGSADGHPDGSAKTDVPPGGVLVLYPGTAWPRTGRRQHWRPPAAAG